MPLLKEHKGPIPTQLGSVPDVDELGLLAGEPVAILAQKLGKKGNKLWSSCLYSGPTNPKKRQLGSSTRTWKPNFQISTLKLEDKLFNGGGN